MSDPAISKFDLHHQINPVSSGCNAFDRLSSHVCALIRYLPSVRSLRLVEAR